MLRYATVKGTKVIGHKEGQPVTTEINAQPHFREGTEAVITLTVDALCLNTLRNVLRSEILLRRTSRALYPLLNTCKNALCGISTRPTCFMRCLPFF